MDQPTQGGGSGQEPFVVVAGYGLPGRSLVEFLIRRHLKYVVIELNPQTCERAAAGGVNMVMGSVTDAQTLHEAGIARATLVALMVPNDEVVLASVALVRKVNKRAHVIARCSFTSTGLEAMRRGADHSIVAEQVIARELQGITAQFFDGIR
jgi:Trk K+ transport system NAD-binding subunit